MNNLRPVSLEELHAAAQRIKSVINRTPLIKLNVQDAPAEIYLKMENLQAIGSFKIRPGASVILNVEKEKIADGVYTASSGNMAQGVAYAAREAGVAATVLLPQNAAANKVAAIERLGASIRFMKDEEWWQVLKDHGHPEIKGLFIHPVANQDVLAGDATVGLEIIEDLPDVDTVLVPFGGGGLACGIASAFRALGSPARVLGAESLHCAPLEAALSAGKPLDLPVVPSFISGIGIGHVLDEMWPLIEDLVTGSVVASLEEIANSIKILFERNRIIAEGAGASGVASALAGRGGTGKVVCVISGGNLDEKYLIDILQGRVPAA
ncbi:MAG: threonine dehydratase [Gammaproteobacteria bacterium]|jgi:threonine dehydratase